MRRWREIFKPITERSKAKPKRFGITFDTQFKTAFLFLFSFYREVQLHSQYKSSYHALWSYVSELQFRIIFLVCSVTVLAAILLYCRRIRRMSKTSNFWHYDSSPVLYNIDVIPSIEKMPMR